LINGVRNLVDVTGISVAGTVLARSDDARRMRTLHCARCRKKISRPLSFCHDREKNARHPARAAHATLSGRGREI
jgi:hypothetical protein